MGLACWEAPHWGGLFAFPPGAKAGAVPVCALPSRYLSRVSGRLRLRVQNRRTPHEAGDCGRAGRARCPCPRDVRFPLNTGGVKRCQYRDASSRVNGGKCAQGWFAPTAGGTQKGVGAGPETSGRFQILSCYLGRTLRQSRQIGPVPAVRIIGKNPQSSSSTSDLAMKWT